MLLILLALKSLAAWVARSASLPARAVFAGITEAAKAGNEVSLHSFGKFKDSLAQQGRNPATGATIRIAATRKLTFALAKQIKEVLAG